MLAVYDDYVEQYNDTTVGNDNHRQMWQNQVIRHHDGTALVSIVFPYQHMPLNSHCPREGGGDSLYSVVYLCWHLKGMIFGMFFIIYCPF